jgi:hypothetical protein
VAEPLHGSRPLDLEEATTRGCQASDRIGSWAEVLNGRPAALTVQESRRRTVPSEDSETEVTLIRAANPARRQVM